MAVGAETLKRSSSIAPDDPGATRRDAMSFARAPDPLRSPRGSGRTTPVERRSPRVSRATSRASLLGLDDDDARKMTVATTRDDDETTTTTTTTTTAAVAVATREEEEEDAPGASRVARYAGPTRASSAKSRLAVASPASSPRDGETDDDADGAPRTRDDADDDDDDDADDARALFRALDRSGDGLVTIRELVIGLRARPAIARRLRLPSSVRQEDGSRDAIELWFQSLDANEDRALSLEEFSRHFVAEAPPPPPPPPRETGTETSARAEMESLRNGVHHANGVVRKAVSSSPNSTTTREKERVRLERGAASTLTSTPTPPSPVVEFARVDVPLEDFRALARAFAEGKRSSLPERGATTPLRRGELPRASALGGVGGVATGSTFGEVFTRDQLASAAAFRDAAIGRARVRDGAFVGDYRAAVAAAAGGEATTTTTASIASPPPPRWGVSSPEEERADSLRERVDALTASVAALRGGTTTTMTAAAAATGKYSRPPPPPLSSSASGAFYTLVPIRSRSRGERRSLRTFAGVSLRLPPRSIPARDAFQLQLTPFNSTPISSLCMYGTALSPGSPRGVQADAAGVDARGRPRGRPRLPRRRTRSSRSRRRTRPRARGSAHVGSAGAF